MESFNDWIKKKKKEETEGSKPSVSMSNDTYNSASPKKETFNDWLNNKRSSLVNSDYIDKFVNDSQNYYNSAKNNLNGSYSDSYSDMFEDYRTKGIDLKNRADAISYYLDANKDKIDNKSYDSLSSYINGFKGGVDDIVRGFRDSRDFFSQFDNEDAYKNAVESYNTYRADENNTDSFEDFTRYSKIGADIKNPSAWEANAGPNIFGWKPFAKDVQNPVTFARDNYEGFISAGDDANTLYNQMTEGEVGVYNYYLAKEREGLLPKGSADNYIKSIETYLNARQAGAIVDNLGLDSDVFGADTLRVAFGFASGLNQFGEGMRNLFNTEDDYIAPSAMQYASQMVRDQMGFIGKGAYDVASTTGNMIPNIVASAALTAVGSPVLGSVVGTSLMGASAAGNEYAELLNDGMTKSQARTLSTLLGIWEGASEAALGGLEGLAQNKLSEKYAMKGFKKFLLDMAQEGGEEVVQDIGSSIINGVFNKIAQNGRDTEWSTFGEQTYNFVLGALSAGVLNGAGLGLSKAVYSNELKNDSNSIVGNKEKINALKDVGSKYSVDSVAYQLAGQIDENTDAVTIAKMLRSIDAELSEQNKADIVNNLVSKGVADSDANTIASWMGRYIEGEKLSKSQLKALSTNETIQSAFKELVDSNSTVNQRLYNIAKARGINQQFGENADVINGKSSDEISKSATDMIRDMSELGVDSKTYMSRNLSDVNKVMSAMYGRELTKESGSDIRMRSSYSRDIAEKADSDIRDMKSSIAKKEAEKSSLGIRNVEKAINNAEKNTSVSENGKTTLADTGEEVKISKIASISNGSMELQLSDGRTVDSKNVLFSSKDSSIVYDSIAELGYSVDAANAIANMFNAEMSKPSDSAMSASRFMLAVNEAYNYGLIGEQTMNGSAFANELSPSQRKAVYELGRKASEESTKKAQDRIVTYERNASNMPARKGTIFVPYSYKSMTKRQKSSIKAIARIVSINGNNVHIFESYIDKDGVRVAPQEIQDKIGRREAPNGFYDPKTGDIYIDLNAGNNGEGVMLYTFAHELTHFVRAWSPEKFKVLADFVIAEYGKKGVSVNTMIQERIKRSNNKLTYDEAYEEVIADSMESMFTDADLATKIAKLKATDKNFWTKIKDFFVRLYNEIKAVYSELDPQTDAGMMVKSWKDELDTIADIFAEGIVEAGNNFRNADVTLNDGSASFSLREKENIENRSMKFYDANKNGSASHISSKMITEANKIINKMADYMLPFLDIKNNNGKRYLPEEILGKTTFANGSYGKTIENTTICFRTLAYIDFTNEIKKKIGRPLTVEESFLASQMLYDIAKEPQCLYCYVSLDRKAYDGFLLEYIKQRDDVLNKFAKMDDKSKKNIDALYTEFLNGRKDTKQMKQRFNLWINSAVSGDGLISLSDLTTEEVRSELKNGKYADQVIDAERYAQSASWAKKLEQYRSYNSDILNMSPAMVKKLNAHYGLRFYSFSEYTPAFIVENMQQIRDASMKGLYGLAYTKKTDFARIFANTGMNINISVFGKMVKGKVEADTRQGADWSEVQKLRKQFKNVGAVFVATNDELTEWALAQDWIDVVIPFHIVRTGANVAEFYKWTNNTKFQADVDASGKNKTITPAEHHNDLATFKRLVEERGLTPRFAQFIKNPNYMKLVNETRLADTESSILTPNFNEDAAIKSFDAFVNDGGYYGNWYEEGIDYKKAVDVVADDVLAGRRANEVSYGRQDINLDEETKRKNRARVHGKEMYSLREVDPVIPKSSEWNRSVNTTEAMRIYPNLWNVSADESETRNPTQVTSTVKTYRKIYDILKGEGFNGNILDASSGLGYGTKAGIDEYGFNVDDIEPYPSNEYKPKYTDYSKLNKKYDVIISNAVLNVLPQEQRDALVVKMGQLLNNGGRIFINVRSLSEIQALQKVVDKKTGKVKNITISDSEVAETSKGSYQKGFKKSELVAYLKDALGSGFSVEQTSKFGDTSVIVTKKSTKLSDRDVDNNGAKFSDRDSEGNKLTKAQQEYFKDSKVRDSEGTLLVMYHGTGADFTEFDRNFIGKTGAFEGAGFNFTPSEGRASSYGGRVMSGYINVTRPLSSDSVTMNARELAKLIEKLDPTGDDIIANYARDTRDYGTPSFVKREALTTARAVLQYADNDVDVYSDLSAGSGGNVSLIEGFEELGYDGVIHYNDDGSIKTVITFNSNQFKNTDNTNPTTDADIRYSDRDYAPVWYSKMTNVINDIKPAKMGATGVVPYLKGKGIKDEEIKWSGIATFLEGKKSVTKEELQEFAKNSSLNISEETLSNYEAEFDEFDRLLNKYTDLTAYDYDPDFYSSAEDFARSQIDDYLEDGSITQEQYDEIIESAKKIGTEGTRWNDYVVSVGKNYREILFRLPNSNYINDAMKTHWGREGVLAHARLQDFDTKDFGKMLFIEEIQSDWHNAGNKFGYASKTSVNPKAFNVRENDGYYRLFADGQDTGISISEDFASERGKTDNAQILELLKDIYDNNERMVRKGSPAPDAPFKNYTDFVLKRLLRMAAEGGYDSIGWTTGEMQEDRWSSEYAEGYRIEYDQDIPKFLNKYGKQWGAKVEMTSASDEDSIVSRNSDLIAYKDGDRIEHRNGLWVYKDSSGYERGAVHDDISIDEAAKELRKTFGKKSTPSHYAMMLTDSMKESVLYKGQPMFSERDTESFDNRTLLANAMESVAKNDIEKKYIENYKSKIDAINEEERKLSYLRAEIKELSFSKGKRDTERIKSLQDEATKSANRINTYDKQLLKLEASAPLKSVLEREKASAIKRAEAKANKALSAYKERAMQRQADIIDKYQEARRKGIDQRQSTRLRNAVKKYIEDFRKRIQHPTDRRYIPSNLVSGIIDVYDMIDPTGENQETLAAQKYRSIKEALADLKLQYDSLAQNDDYDFSSEFDSEFSKRIAELANSVGNTPLRDMSRNQLEDVYEIIHDISVMIRQATKLIGTDEAITNYEAGQEVIDNMRSVKSLGLTTNRVGDFFREWTLNPMRAVREMSGFDDNSMLVKLFNGLNEGRRKADKFKMDSTKKFDALRSTKNGEKAFNDAVEKATITVYDTEGKEVKISKMQAMQAILTYEREQANKNRNHLESPVRFTNVEDDVKGKYSNAFDNGHDVYVDENFVQRCRKEFSEWDNRYIDLARQFFNEDSKNAINEVSLLTKHRLTATENAYIPYKVNSDYIAKESDNVKYDASIGGAGILKSVKNNAPQQLVMRGLNALIDEHIDDVAKIYGFTVPVRNFNKVFNMKQTKEDGGIPVKSAIRDAWHNGGLNLIDQAVADIQSNRRTESSKALSSVKSAFVTSTLASNISVWMKQAASYPTAGSILSTKSLTKALPYFAQNLENVWNEIDEHTPQHWIRRQGLSSQELGEMNQSHGWQNRLNKSLGAFSPMNWIQAMDVKTTAVLWIACKNEVESMGIKPSDASYFDKVTELYDKVIEDTQPMYDSLHRAEITKNSAWKNIIMFQTQPIQNSGILREGAMEYKMAKKQYGNNSKQAKDSLKKFKMAVASQMASHLTFTAMTLLAAAILHKMNPYRDDDKELTTESVLNEFGKQFTKNFFGAIVPVFGTYAASIIEKFEGGNRYDVISDPTVDKINSTIDTFSKLRKPSLSNFKDVLVDVSTYFGIPAKNAENIVNGVKLHIQDISGSGFLSFEAGVERTGKQDYRRVYESIIENDKEEIARLKKKYGDKYSSEVRKALADNDSRITEAAKARIDGDVSTYTSIARSIIADGFTQDDVVSAINTKINSLKKGETPTPTSTPKSNSLYDINDFATAIETNNRSMMEEIRNDMIEISVVNGKTRESAEESFAKSAYNAIKDGYELGQITDTQAVDALVKYGGKSEDYAESKVRFWRFQEDYPEYDITEDQLNRYYSSIDGLGYSINESGISVKEYADYVIRRKNCVGTDEDGDGKTDSGSVKAEVLKLIDRMPISNYQKDALYYLNGWSAKTIDEAGWH